MDREGMWVEYVNWMYLAQQETVPGSCGHGDETSGYVEG
jgi:hypothetical protein